MTATVAVPRAFHPRSLPPAPAHLSTAEEGLGILSVNDQSLLSIAQGHGGALQLQVSKGQVEENKQLGGLHQVLLLGGAVRRWRSNKACRKEETGGREKVVLCTANPKNTHNQS